MKVVTPAQMNDIDRRTITEIGIPGILLMENAALKVVEEIEKDIRNIKGKCIAVFAGKGNNGGDAFAVARHLFNKGAGIKVYISAERDSIGEDAGVNLRIIENMGIDILEIAGTESTDTIKQQVSQADLIVDGILGTGLKGEVRGGSKKAIDMINSSGKPVISIDIPSGICGATGRILGAGIKAYKTVTFALPKLGLVVHPGIEYTGELVVADIGIPSKVIEELNIELQLAEAEDISRTLPVRRRDSNKGDYGRVLIVSGSAGMTGAGILSAKAALRTGAGLVYLGVPSSLASVYSSAFAESVTVPLEDEGRGILSERCIPQLEERMDRMSVIAVGPGLSAEEDIYHIVKKVVSGSKVPVVLDADALNVLAGDVSLLENLKADAVLTPHPGEMSRLAGISVKEVQSNRIEVAREFARRWGVTVVLKGSRTVGAFPDGKLLVNTTGNSGMATAGAGDVLTGVISGLIGQGLSVRDAAAAGVYLHGLAGDKAAEIMGEHGLIAGDLIEELPYVMKELAGMNKACTLPQYR